MKVLITYGGTKEPIDKVRYIGNMSSGRTGQSIATHFIQAGAEVSVLKAEALPDIEKAQKQITFFSYDDLQETLLQEIQTNSYDAVIHAAAVSDYRVTQVTSNNDESLAVGGKIRSGQKLQLLLKPTPKLLDKIKDFSKNKQTILVGFKLTESANPQERADAVYKIFNAGASIVVQNDLTDITKDTHKCEIYTSMQNKLSVNTKEQLAEKLFGLIKERL